MPTTRRFIDVLYRALREDQTGTLPQESVAIGSLDVQRSSIVLRVEALLKIVDHEKASAESGAVPK